MTDLLNNAIKEQYQPIANILTKLCDWKWISQVFPPISPAELLEYQIFVICKCVAKDFEIDEYNTRSLLSPTAEIDRVWHEHLLRPQYYISMNLLLSDYLDDEVVQNDRELQPDGTKRLMILQHNPEFSKDPQAMKDKRIERFQSFRREVVKKTTTMMQTQTPTPTTATTSSTSVPSTNVNLVALLTTPTPIATPSSQVTRASSAKRPAEYPDNTIKSKIKIDNNELATCLKALGKLKKRKMDIPAINKLFASYALPWTAIWDTFRQRINYCQKDEQGKIISHQVAKPSIEQLSNSLKVTTTTIVHPPIATATTSETSSKATVLNKANKAENEIVTIDVMSPHFTRLTYKVPRTVPLSRLMTNYATRNQVELGILRFFLDGEIIRYDDTVHSLEMEDGDKIDVLLEQIGC